LVYNGAANKFYTTRFQRREDCMSHETYPEPMELALSATTHSGDDLIQAVCREVDGSWDTSRIELDRDLVISIDCEPCGTSRPVMRPRQLVGHRDAACERCGQMARPRIEHVVEAGSQLAQAKLAELGIPAYDIVRVVSPEDERAVLLAGDRPNLRSS
jgi:adenylyltransferase/sulfurtransferase